MHIIMKKLIRNNIDIVIVSLILAALLIIIFRDVIFSDAVFVRRDISRYYYPLRHLAAEIFRSGQVPLWNPNIFCGMPFLATIQSVIFYPLSLMHYLMDPARALSLFIILHLFLSGLFMYLFARSRNISMGGSFIAAFSFTFSGYMMSVINLTISLSAIAWFPLAMLLFFRTLKTRDYRDSLWLSLVMVIMFLAGEPAVAISMFSIMLAASLYLLLERLVKEKLLDRFLIVNFLLVSAAFLSLAAFQILPAIEFFRMTQRMDIGLTEATIWSIPPTDLLSLFVPFFNDFSYYYFNYWAVQVWLDNYYTGITIIMLGLFAVAAIRKDRLVQFLCVIALLSLAISLGKNFLLYPLLYKTVPFVRLMRYPVRFFFVFTFAVCVLSGIGYDRLRQLVRDPVAASRARAFLIAAILFVGAALVLTLAAANIQAPLADKLEALAAKDPGLKRSQFYMLVHADIFNLRRSLMYMGYFGLFVFLWFRTKYKNFAAAAIFLLITLDLLLTNTGYEPMLDRDYFKAPTGNLEYIMNDKSLFRVLPSPSVVDKFNIIKEGTYSEATRAMKDRFMTNRMVEYGMYYAGGYESAILKRSADVVGMIYTSKNPKDTNLIDLLNVKYIALDPNMNIKEYEKAMESPYAAIYRNNSCLERAFLVRRSKVMPADADILKYMGSKEFKPAEEIVLENEVKLPAAARLPAGDIGKDSVNIIKYTPNEVEIDLYAASPAFMLMSDTYYPGWKAYIDGMRTKIYRADYFLRAIVMPQGRHSIRLIYDPLSFKLGLAISLISIIVVLYLLLKKNIS